MARHDKLLLTSILLSAVSFAFTVLFSALAAAQPIQGLFLSTTSNVSSRYKLEVTPAGWTSSLWAVTYFWNGLWIIYELFRICRRTDMDYTSCMPRVHPAIFFELWILANLLNIGWLFLWDREYFVAALYMITLLPVVCSVMLSISYKNCFKHGSWLTINSPLDLWCIRILVHNGLATYMTWTFFVCLINFGMVLKYDGRVGDDYISPIVMYLALFGLLFWFLLESFVLDEFVRYTVTIYPVATVALFGIFLRKGIPTGRLSETDLVIAVVMAVSIVACFLRVILLFLCDKLRPLFQVENYTSMNKAGRVSEHSFTSEIIEQVSHTDKDIPTDDDI
ncbi:hypothetical protein NDU88_005869 [Pleurodeles waltl]|uniref:Uncharacterized protein n=1 Tax=Pleurodeles waltl TaxID=8319 RepID=A0AAV7VMY0_PLEWA|nr:hypothetical protein NDU88_005869 [Pleurodeles waltl]